MTKLREKIGYFDGENNPNYNNIRIKDDDIMYKGGYIWQRKINHPFATEDGWIRQHRLVAEQYLLTEENSIVINNNKYLSPEYEVHHKDFNKHNNNPNNLTILTKSEHMKLHQKIKKEGNNIMEIKVKYHNKNIDKIEKIEVGDWIDLRSAETVTLKQGDFKLISLGVSIQLPNGYEAHVVPRSSTFKKWGIIQTNSCGIIDESYCGNNDIWMMPVIAMRDTKINENDRICQFRIVDKMPRARIVEVDNLDNEDRGGFGSTGSN